MVLELILNGKVIPQLSDAVDIRSTPATISPGLEVVRYCVEVLHQPVTSQIIWDAVTHGLWNIAKYLLAIYPSFDYMDVFNDDDSDDLYNEEYMINVPVDLEGLHLIYQLVGEDHFRDVFGNGDDVYYHIAGGSNDNSECIQFLQLVNELQSFDSDMIIRIGISLDNIKCLAWLGVKPDKSVLTADQIRRLNHYRLLLN